MKKFVCPSNSMKKFVCPKITGAPYV